jgi:hypothetical protein
MSMNSRVALGTAAVLSVEEAAAWLPMEPEEAASWLRSSGIVRSVWVGGREIEVVVWGDVVAAIQSEGEAEGPLTTWRAIAQAVGVSEDTLARRRGDAADQTAPYFVDAQAARAWYQGLLAPKPKEKAPRRQARPKPVEPQVVDWKAVAKGKWPR